MLTKNEIGRVTLGDNEEAWNVMTGDYLSVGISQGSIVVSSTTIPKGWNMREPKLVILLIEGEGDRGPTGANFIRTMLMAPRGEVHFEPNDFDAKFPVTFVGFVKEVITRQIL